MDESGERVRIDCVSDGGAYDPEREKVRELRLRELSCLEIAEKLRIPEGTVLLHCLKLGLPVTGSCRRIPIPKEDEEWLRDHPGEPRYGKCQTCGKDIIQPLTGRQKKYCSVTCRNQYWNEKWRREAKERGRRAVCENCGKVFYAVHERVPRRFCCQDCYFDFRYGRRGNGDEY